MSCLRSFIVSIEQTLGSVKALWRSNDCSRCCVHSTHSCNTPAKKGLGECFVIRFRLDGNWHARITNLRTRMLTSGFGIDFGVRLVLQKFKCGLQSTMRGIQIQQNWFSMLGINDVQFAVIAAAVAGVEGWKVFVLLQRIRTRASVENVHWTKFWIRKMKVAQLWEKIPFGNVSKFKLWWMINNYTVVLNCKYSFWSYNRNYVLTVVNSRTVTRGILNLQSF